MEAVILCLLAIILLLFYFEDRRAKRERAALRHVVYVNGIRGKSTVTRLIDAGLRAGGYRVFCKTTGTEPMTIAVDNIERPIVRHGRANIKEQLMILHRAVKEHADILVLECMAVDPVLQRISQERMVRSDVGVITNIRLDHTAEMGDTPEKICDSLSGTIPQGGVLFTADAAFFAQLEKNAVQKACRVVLTQPDDDLPADDFPENIALALAVCMHLGVERETALSGMRQYQPDPYALGFFTLPGGCVFVNALSANDPQSTVLICRRVCSKNNLSSRRLILLINNRRDRGYRTQHMLLVAQSLDAAEIWLLGASQSAVRRALKHLLPDTPVREFRNANLLPLAECTDNDLVFAVGNIAHDGKTLMERVRGEGVPYVS